MSSRFWYWKQRREEEDAYHAEVWARRERERQQAATEAAQKLREAIQALEKPPKPRIKGKTPPQSP